MVRLKGELNKNPKVTAKQKGAIDNVLTGKSKSLGGAMREAGYSDQSAKSPGYNLLARRGVQKYLSELDRVSKEKWGLAIKDKLALTYVEGLEATKLYGKEALEHPDWMARHKFADSIAHFFELVEARQEKGSLQANQFNFFSVTPEERKKFNETFESFMHKFYK